jgi:hypothetical protein
MDSFDRGQRKELRRLAGLAHERELSAALTALEARFDQWRAGTLDAHGLSDAIHQFHDQSARDLYVTYTRLTPEIAVAQAIARGIIRADEVPTTICDALQPVIAFYARD